MKKENQIILFKEWGFIEAIPNELLEKEIDLGVCPGSDIRLFKTNEAIWYPESDEYYFGGNPVPQRTFIEYVKLHSTEEENLKFKRMNQILVCKEIVKDSETMIRLLPAVKQAICQAVGTIPSQVNNMNHLKEEEKLMVKEWARNAVETCIIEFDIKSTDIEPYWGLN